MVFMSLRPLKGSPRFHWWVTTTNPPLCEKIPANVGGVSQGSRSGASQMTSFGWFGRIWARRRRENFGFFGPFPPWKPFKKCKIFAPAAGQIFRPDYVSHPRTQISLADLVKQRGGFPRRGGGFPCPYPVMLRAQCWQIIFVTGTYFE